MLRPEISPSLRATFVPPGFQTQPVLQALQHADLLQELHAQQQTARIHALKHALAAARDDGRGQFAQVIFDPRARS